MVRGRVYFWWVWIFRKLRILQEDKLTKQRLSVFASVLTNRDILHLPEDMVLDDATLVQAVGWLRARMYISYLPVGLGLHESYNPTWRGDLWYLAWRGRFPWVK